MTKEKQNNESIYIDYNTGDIIVAKNKGNDNYAFYATKIGEGRRIEDIDFDHMQPIDDIFDYIDKNKLEINAYSKELSAIKGNKNGK